MSNSTKVKVIEEANVVAKPARDTQAVTVVKAKKAALELMVEKAIAGDGDALRNLCEVLGRSVIFRVKYMLGNNMSQMDAEDVSQEVFIRVCEKINTLRSPKAFGKWLSSIIINETNRYAKNATENGITYNIDEYLEDVLESNAEFIPEAYVENSEFREGLMEIILNLPTRQRQAIILHYYSGFGTTEIADMMSITHQGVSKNLALARENIKVALKKQPIMGCFSAISLLSIDSLLPRVIHVEAIGFASQGAAIVESVLAPCAKFFAVNSTAKAAATAAAKAQSYEIIGVVVGVIATICIAGLISLGLWGSDASPNVVEEIPAHSTVIEGSVLFTGGERYNGTNRVNPAQAKPHIESANGEVTVVRWWITEQGSETVLYSGEGADASAALASLRETGAPGAYMIYFALEVESGRVDTMGANFLIRELLD